LKINLINLMMMIIFMMV